MPNDQPEALSAVIADYRKDITYGLLFEPTQEYISRLLDRIEAAAKREEDRRRDEVLSLQRTIVKMQDAIARQADAVNAAAMRAVVERCRDYLSDLLTLVSPEDEIRLLKECNVALSAPARNCDRYTTAKDALDAFIREKEIKSADVDNMNLRDFFVWLFAKAEGKDNSNG